jgi:hypothetical protein
MRLSMLLAGCLLFFAVQAQYVFTGNGAWSDLNNWQGGIKPGSTIAAGATVTIQGTATTTLSFPVDIGGNSGTITIASGGSLIINNATQFANQGSVIVNGTLTSNTVMWEAFIGSSITVNGIFNNQKSLGNQGLLTVNSTGVVNNTGSLDNTFVNPGVIVVNCGGAINNNSPGVFKPGNITFNGCGGITNGSTISGNSTITGNLTNSGTISPGNSPGTITITGDYSATATAIHKIEVGGTASGSYDVISVGGTATLSGTLNVTLINGFTPFTSHDITIMTGAIVGTFTTVNIPASYILIYNTNSVVLRHSAILPVNFVRIDVKKDGAKQNIIWEVRDEHNISNYDIEKSTDGLRFSRSGSLIATGADHYSFIDTKSETSCFYRIRSIDVGGQFKYSAVIHYAQGKSGINLNVYPSPVSTEAVVQHSSADMNASITLLSIDGRVMKMILPAKQAQETTIDFSALRPGLYFIKFNNGKGQAETIKVEKL